MKKIILLLFVFLSIQAIAQQLPDFSLFKENQFVYNPAMAGNEQNMFIYLSSRKQWSKINQSPLTINAAFHMPLENDRLNVGGSIFNDFTGPTSFTGLSGAFAYRLIFSRYIPGVSEYKALAFGMSASVVQYRLNGQQLDLDDPNDPQVLQASGGQIFPDASFGMYYHSRKFYAGLAIPQLLYLNVPIEAQQRTTKFRKVQHYYAAFGGRIFLRDGYNLRDLSLDADFNVHYVIGAPPQGFASLRFSIEELGYIGVGYRSVSAMLFQGGITIANRFDIGYSYDLELSNIRPDLGGVHEIYMSFELKKQMFGY